jgi:hypothetical protein
MTLHCRNKPFQASSLRARTRFVGIGGPNVKDTRLHITSERNLTVYLRDFHAKLPRPTGLLHCYQVSQDAVVQAPRERGKLQQLLVLPTLRLRRP